MGGMRTPDRIVVTVFASVLSFGGSYAANGFLAMAIGAITTRESMIRAVWSRRILIDAAIALVPLLAVGM